MEAARARADATKGMTGARTARVAAREEWNKVTRGLRAVRRAAAIKGVEDCRAIPHDLYGTLLCRPVTLRAEWLSSKDGTVPKLAQAIYDDRAFDRRPILADALEDAGCADAYILSHCRGQGPHVRGCWVVDLLLYLISASLRNSQSHCVPLPMILQPDDSIAEAGPPGAFTPVADGIVAEVECGQPGQVGRGG